jgi:hypothetical protein
MQSFVYFFFLVSFVDMWEPQINQLPTTNSRSGARMRGSFRERGDVGRRPTSLVGEVGLLELCLYSWFARESA